MTSLALSFNDVNFSAIQQDGQIWLTSTELAKGLDYSDTRSVTKIFNRNQDEFTDAMTQVVNLTTSNKNNELQEVKTRIFSLRGCHLIAMFARTSVAKQFRKWVLDILDKEVGKPVSVVPLVTAEQKQMLKEAVNSRHHRTGEHWQTIYTKLHEFIGVNSYHEIPFNRFDEAMNWLCDGFGKPILPTSAPWNDTDVQFLMFFVPTISKIIKNDIYPALSMLRSGYAAQVIGIAQEMAAHANSLNRRALKHGMTHYTQLGEHPIHTIEWYLS
ncbi:BRO family protein [Acinetobacter baumannii]|uniref:BRO-N domain-containing protein n=1 Tax=Acinetobacter baumannii TaxID=470 RepID=UPI00244C7FE0|nr:BRO family protein [Acinetobacter baumannii]EHZ6732566.1 hypothetical protein [Acinetobacter baumannii]EKT8703292.1 hypothetical protein [Acinetobacter baumannii]EKV2135299.1 hypothetical protein [Acinetobacter baumannii]MDH2666805.1 BRO family protein [Acinetobacter baumannii]